MKTITLITESLRQYRKRFHELLRSELKNIGIEYNLIYGRPPESEKTKGDEVDLDWALKINNKYFNIGDIELCWQPCLKFIQDSDLIIVTQANKLLINYLLILRRKLGGSKLAFWGHGRNFQSKNPSGIKEKFKNFFVNQVDWWFAYNELTVDILRNGGFPQDHISDVQNSIDTKELMECKKQITPQEISLLKKELKLENGPVGIYCGGMYREKCLPFLLDACKLIRAKLLDFQMIFIGEGPESNVVKQSASVHEWMHFLGPKFGIDKVRYFCLADVLLMPGLVGLSILDAFALELPLITTKYEFHSPEIAYLKNAVNGIMTEDSLEAYAAGVGGLLNDKEKYNRIISGCRQSAQKYSIENMVNNFAKGIDSALEIKR